MAAVNQPFLSERQQALRHLDRLARSTPPMIWTADRDGKILWLNESWQRFTGRTLEQESGEGWLEGVHPDDRAGCCQEYRSAIRGGLPFHREFRVQTAGGDSRLVAGAGLPRLSLDKEQPSPGYVGSFTDITALQTAETERDHAVQERDAALREVEHLLDELEPIRHAKRVFLRDVLRTVTDGRLLLCVTARDLPKALPLLAGPMPLTNDTGSAFRDAVRKAADTCGLPPARIFDLVVGTGEATTNAVRHAGGGTGRVCGDPKTGLVQVWVEDRGHGIDLGILPRATLERGFSEDGGFGYGFWMMFHAVDRTYLLTGRRGTTVVLEHGRASASGDPAHTILEQAPTEDTTTHDSSNGQRSGDGQHAEREQAPAE